MYKFDDAKKDPNYEDAMSELSELDYLNMYLSGLNLMDLILEMILVECIVAYGSKSTDRNAVATSAFAFITSNKVQSEAPSYKEDPNYHKALDR